MRIVVIPVAAVLMLAVPAAADPGPTEPEPPPPDVSVETPAEKARRGLDLLLQALEGWINQLPSYAPPEVAPNGDIIIRRLDKPGVPAHPSDPATPGGATRL